ncbi:hypothetical protein D3C72_1381090 [compost metagenome]
MAADLEHLLHRPTWPQPCGEARDNPMFMPARRGVRVADRSAPPVTLHRQCCLYYLVPRLGYCGACPLSPEFERERCASTPPTKHPAAARVFLLHPTHRPHPGGFA